MIDLPVIPPFDEEAAKRAAARQRELTKPAGALGRLEDLSVQLAGITAQERPQFDRKAVILMAADHGVAREGVSAYPPQVTRQMAANIAGGGAAVSVLARQAGARVVAVDIGIAGDTRAIEGLLQYKVAPGSGNMREGPALTRTQVEQAINVGLRVVREQAEQGLDIVALGEMGIGNTTPAAALTAVFTGAPVEQVTGRGTGLDDAGLAHKMDVIKESIHVNQPDADDALDVLSKLGGLDIAGLVGVIIGAASLRLPVVVDGFISAAAALTAVRLLPQVRPNLIASHRSLEAGHDVICENMGFEPLLDLKMRLGEGSGAVLALHLVEAAARILNEMSTFSDAGVSQK